VRALIDRHHADLFYSLQLLFEDRMGVSVYTPTGHEWWDEGYWNFGRGTWPDDRLAQQYLLPVTVEQYDGHHPERLIRGVTLELARQMRWDYVVATLQDNQHGFKKFADEVGAKFVMQVGNTGQLVDWGLDPLVLMASEMPIRGRGILYHQEFEAETTFRFRDLEDGTTIRSFVNCFPETPCHQTFGEVRDLMPEFRFESYGIGTPGDVVTPVQRIADLMAESGWGWHDKAHGDGFGHVIHNWAAVGRPLIGHASHYRGRMAEVFWEDGVTCIDLDRHPVTESTGLIREITADRKAHEAMCREIRRRFDEIDFDAEAEAIREFLA
jgi:hypothetical protein